jgi:hypothetical protein
MCFKVVCECTLSVTLHGMQYTEFQQALDEAGLSLREFALLLKLNPNSVTNYKKRGTVPSHLGVIACLVRELNAHHIDYRSVLAHIPIEPKASRGSMRSHFGRSTA